MKIGIISDIHGNILALEQCVKYLNQIEAEKIYFLGDAIGYFQHSNEVLDLLSSISTGCIKGNHEAMYLNQLPLNPIKDNVYRLGELKKTLNKSHELNIFTWPTFIETQFGDLKILMVHGSPDKYLEGYVYPNTDLTPFKNLSYDYVFMGHTHRPFIGKIGDLNMVNVGSVGLPRDVGNLSSICIFDDILKTCEIKRIPFNLDDILLHEEKLHFSVLDCLKRTTKDFVGEVIL